MEMKRATIGSLLLLAAATFFAPAPAVAGDVDVNAELRSRFEFLEDFDDFDDDMGSSFDFTTYRLRLGLDFELTDNLTASIVTQHNGAWGDTFVRGTGDPFIDGSSSAADKDATLLYQAFVDWKEVGGTPVTLRIGRQEHTLGNELHLGDNDFYNGMSFDGIRAMVDFELSDLDVFYYTIVERDLVGPGGFTGGAGSNDTTLAGITVNFDVAETQTVEPYLLYFRDDNNTGGLNFTNNFYTLGVLYTNPQDAGFDWSIEGALQRGDTTTDDCPAGPGVECDLESYIAEGWFGYTFGGDGQHRVHIGGLLLGDGNDAEDQETFNALFPDTHRRAGAMDLFSESSSSAIVGFSGTDTFNNLTVLDVGYEWSSGPHSFSATYLDFTATEDLVGGEDDIGSEVDFIYELESSEHLALQLGVASFMPGDAFVSPADDDPLRFWAMLRVSK